YPGRDGHMEALDRDETTSSELLARHLPGTRVVKAFNTMNYVPFGERGDPAAPIDERLALYVAGDDADAKAVVSGLIEDLGFAAVDAGGLADGGRRLQPGSPVYAADLTAAQAAEHLRR
ncbi:MAG: NADPH-dependent F420 reductase, partial [Solirubrobacteraceae bacterium]